MTPRKASGHLLIEDVTDTQVPPPRVTRLIRGAYGIATATRGQSSTTCPACRQDGLVKRSDLKYESTNGLASVIVANLEGVSCGSCGRVWYTPASASVIKQHVAPERPTGDYEVRVTRVGGSSLGLYLPKDLVRVMKIEAGMTGLATPVESGVFAISFAVSDAPQRDAIDDMLLMS